MKTTLLLLTPKIISIKNSITLKAFLKRFPFIFIYIFNFRTLSLKTLSEIFPFIKEFMVLINMLMAGLVLSAVSVRFLYSSISLEGMAFWIIRTSPVTVKKLQWLKFLEHFLFNWTYFTFLHNLSFYVCDCFIFMHYSI